MGVRFDSAGTARRQDCIGLLWVLILVFLSYGCTKQVRSSPTITKKDASLEALLNLYQNRLNPNFGIKALMEVKTLNPNQGGHSFLASWHSKKDTIRIRGFNLFGGTLFELQLEDPTFFLTLPSENKRLEAPLDELEQVAGGKIPFGSLELLEWVKRGGVPLITGLTVPALEKREGHFILYLFTVEKGRARLQEKIWIERTRFWAKKVELFDRTGLRRGVILLDDYRRVGSRYFPFSVSGNTESKTISQNFREVYWVTTPQNVKGDKNE
jgi:outer membrane biogenesis lipoprotein LolB